MNLSMIGPGLLVYGVAYYELQPPYLCTYSNLSSEIPCDHKVVCDDTASDTTLISYRVDKSGAFYLDNWIEQMNL